jgi:hypothetical protein
MAFLKASEIYLSGRKRTIECFISELANFIVLQFKSHYPCRKEYITYHNLKMKL